MMRASLSPRPLLLMAAALTALAVLFAPGAQPAQAQSTGNEVWSSTLTAAVLDTVDGCSTSDDCISAQRLTDNTFDKAIPDSLKLASTVHIGNRQFPAPAGRGDVGCKNGVSGAECSDPRVLSADSFTYTRNIYGDSWKVPYRIGALFVTPEGDLVLAMDKSIPEVFKLVVDGREFHVAEATRTSGGQRARWSRTGMKWVADTTVVQLSMRIQPAALDYIDVYWDEDAAGDFAFHWPANRSGYGYRVMLPGHARYAKLKVSLEHPYFIASVRVGKVTWDANSNKSIAWMPVAGGALSHTIRLDKPSPVTIVYVEVTELGTTKRYTVNVDPPAGPDRGPSRTYSVGARVRAAEGEDAGLTITLSEAAPAEGAKFSVLAGYGDGGATDDDVGSIPSPVTISEGSDTLTVAVPIVDDRIDEDDETFTLTVTPLTAGWPVEAGRDTATVTITDDDCATCGGEGEEPEEEEESQQQQAGKYAELIAQMYEWRNDPQWVSHKTHTDRWDRALLALGETVADATLTPMTGEEAQALADKGWQRWVPVAAAIKDIESGGQQEQPNQAPTVSAAIADATIVNEGGTRQVSLSGAFDDADEDALTITATSSDETVAAVSVAADYSNLSVNAQGRGTATITVTANDGNDGTVADSFTVTVKAAPVVASALADVTGLEAGAEQTVLLSGVFSDADGDSLTISAASSSTAAATVSVTSDYGTLTVTGVAAGTATITVTAKDSDGNQVSDAFDVTVVAAPVAQEPDPQEQQQEPEQTPQEKYADLITQMYEWRNDPQWVSHKAHTDRWDRALLAFGETVSDTSLTPMTASEAQGYADKGWQRWVEVAKALRDIESG